MRLSVNWYCNAYFSLHFSRKYMVCALSIRYSFTRNFNCILLNNRQSTCAGQPTVFNFNFLGGLMKCVNEFKEIYSIYVFIYTYMHINGNFLWPCFELGYEKYCLFTCLQMVKMSIFILIEMFLNSRLACP